MSQSISISFSVVLLSTALGVLTGCPDDPTREPLTYEQYNTQGAAAFCKRQVACGAAASEESCLKSYDDSPAIKAAVVAGRIRFDADAARACLEANAAETSCLWTDLLRSAIASECLAVTTGTLAVGASCTIGEECQSGLCETVGGCDGTCAEVPKAAAVGESCAGQNFCADDAYCNDDEVCAKRRELGEGCSSAAQCGWGMRCDSQTQSCVKGPATGEACVPGSALSCDHVGDYCDSEALVCKKTVELGGACSEFHTYDGCQDPWICKNGQCVAPKELGEACTVGESDCLDAYVCRGGTCQENTAQCE